MSFRSHRERVSRQETGTMTFNAVFSSARISEYTICRQTNETFHWPERLFLFIGHHDNGGASKALEQFMLSRL